VAVDHPRQLRQPGLVLHAGVFGSDHVDRARAHRDAHDGPGAEARSREDAGAAAETEGETGTGTGARAGSSRADHDDRTAGRADAARPDDALTRLALPAGAATFALVAAFVVCEWLRNGVEPEPGGGLHGGKALFLVVLALAFATYLAGLWLVRRGASFAAVFAVACAIQLAPLAGPLFLSSDAWTYWSYARVHDPYRDTPAADPVSSPYAGRAYLHESSPYGPVWSIASRPAGLTRSHDVAAWSFRVLAALGVLAATWLLARRRPFPAALLGWNPVVALQFAGAGHNDALMIALVAVALALGERRRPQAAGVAWALASLVKWVPLLLLPLRGLEARARRRRVGHLGFGSTVVVTLALATVLWRFHWLHALVPLARDASRQTSYALPHRLHLPAWPFAAAYLCAYVWLLREAARGRARLGLAFALLLLALPYLAVWYVLWPVALAAWDDDDAAVVLSLALSAYLLPQRLL
jgi:hypothetical protein